VHAVSSRRYGKILRAFAGVWDRKRRRTAEARPQQIIRRVLDRVKSQRDSRTRREIGRRAAQTLGWVSEQDWLLDTALDQLTLGRWRRKGELEDAEEGAKHCP